MILCEIIFLFNVLVCSALNMEAYGARLTSVNLLVRQNRIMEIRILESEFKS